MPSLVAVRGPSAGKRYALGDLCVLGRSFNSDIYIGDRRVKNKDKTLSLYEPDVHVLVRGKAGAEVEFGNALYLAEQADGLIVDWDFIQEQPRGDSSHVRESVKRLRSEYGTPRSYTADRGFDSPDNRAELEEFDIFNMLFQIHNTIFNSFDIFFLQIFNV